ncbi:MAG: restriction endonuclease [Nitrospira sp.]|nr:restriction endonuclease [Nitrospira sp.]
MAIPDFQTLMLPVLRQLAADGEQAPSSVRSAIATIFKLSEEELAALLPSGRQAIFANRIAWALGYLKQAGLVESPRRGLYRITERGAATLRESIERIDIQYLMRFPEFVAFRTASNDDAEQTPSLAKVAAESTPLTPDEQIRQGYTRLQANLATQLLERVRQASPKFFEELVVELLVAMGYGGSHEDASSVVGQSGDEGIDGIIKEDRLGLDTIYIQAKRWKDSIGRPEIQRFAGALQGQRARKGVFLTTSTFTADARSYATGLQTTIVLIDGAQLAQLMLEFGIGVSQASLVKLWKLDEDYFVEE